MNRITKYGVSRAAYLPVLFLALSALIHSPTLNAQSLASSPGPSCDNYISISGATNISDFTLEQNVPDDLVCGTGESRWLPLPEENIYLITVPVRNFSANNRVVYRDFLDLVNVRKHPYIQIFMDDKDFQSLFGHKKSYSPTIGVTVSGVTRYYRINCYISECVNGKTAITGQQSVNLTDFKLAPPEKSLGLIKVQDELIINFEFTMPEEQNLKLTSL